MFPNHCFMFATGKTCTISATLNETTAAFVTASAAAVVGTSLKPGLRKIAWNRLKYRKNYGLFKSLRKNVN